MNKNVKTALVVVAAAAVGAGVCALLMRGGETAQDKAAKVLVARRTAAAKLGIGDKKKSVRIKDSRKRRVVATPVRPDPPTFDIGSAEEAKLNAAQKALLEEIRAALRAEKRRDIIRLVRRIQSMDEWPDGIPLAIKRASLEALGWCGGSALPEIIGFLGDANAEIVSQAVNYWEDAIAECDHDKDRTLADGTLEEGLATHVKNAAKVVTDSEAMESILSEISSGMRHSVAVDTIKDILQNGNDVAKSSVSVAIEELTDDATIKTAEQLDEWLKENPDDSDDDFMYGGDEASDAGDDD